MIQTLDDRDQAILAEKIAAYDAMTTPRVGDFVLFADEELRRISHIWDFGDGDEPLYQTSRGGSFYFGDGYMSFSGGLFPALPASTFSLVEGRTLEGSCWFFHHNWRQASNGVDVRIDCRVYRCSRHANQ